MAHVLGLMSGTSIDAIDLAHIETDGKASVRSIGFQSFPYEPRFRELIRSCFGNPIGSKDPVVAEIERKFTEVHAVAVASYLASRGLKPENIDLIGFHGQTLLHQPENKLCVQMGDGALLARLTGIPVVNQFRAADVAAGGQGAPLVPLYHRALSINLSLPVAIINIGGVSNITWVGGEADDDLLAFDLGSGNAMIDDWVLTHSGQPYDKDGALALSGRPDMDIVERYLSHAYFKKKPPKSLDRDAFTAFVPHHLSLADGAATLTRMAALAIAQGLTHLPRIPQKLYLTGGGRHNTTLRQWIADLSGLDVDTVDTLGWRGDALEAEAFAYLAVRSCLGLPLSVTGTTGVPAPVSGGVFHPCASRSREG